MLKIGLFYRIIFLFLLLVVLGTPVFAKAEESDFVSVEAENNVKEPVFMFAPMAEASFYGGKRPSIGAGFSVAYDGRAALGLTGMYFHRVSEANDGTRILAVEVTAFVRYYFLPSCLGPFLQFAAGPVFLFPEDEVSFPVKSTSMSVGLTFGWRFPLGNLFYIEPYIRGGNPFIVSGGMSVGIRL